VSRGFVQRSTVLLFAAACTLATKTANAQAQPPPGPAQAQPSAQQSPHESALAEFKQARRLIDAGDCAQALPHLDEALAYEPSIGARMSVAECVDKTNPLRAWRSLAEAALLAYVNHDERMSIIEKRLVELERILPLIEVQLTRSDLERPGLEVLVDGRTIDRYHVRRNLAVEPGPHTVEVRAFGRHPWIQKVTAPSAGAVLRLPVTLVEQSGAAPPPQAPPDPPRVIVRMDPHSTRKTIGLALGATGILAVGTGVVLGVLAIDKREELDRICGGNRQSCTARPEVVTPIRENGSTLAAVSTVSFIVGGAALVSGAALFLWPGSSPQSAARVRVSPNIGTAGAVQGMSVEGVF
jgi:hypothetical protein